MTQPTQSLFERIGMYIHLGEADYDELRRICAEFERQLAEAEANLKDAELRVMTAVATLMQRDTEIAQLEGVVAEKDTALEVAIVELKRHVESKHCAYPGNSAFEIKACSQVLAQCITSRHADDLAVDQFATAMKSKLAKKRKEGRDGWQDKSQCSESDLSYMLIDHINKGDTVDVGNFAMMLHQRKERITTDLLPSWIYTIMPPARSGIESGAEPVCETCHGTGRFYVGNSGLESDGNAPEFEKCPECGYGDSSQPSELEMHRADYEAIKEYGFESPGELLAAWKGLHKQEPYGWVYDNPHLSAQNNFGYRHGAQRPDERASWKPLYTHPAPVVTDGIFLSRSDIKLIHSFTKPYTGRKTNKINLILEAALAAKG